MREKTTRRARWAAVAGGAVCAVLLMAPGASASTTAGWGDELIQLNPGGQQTQGWGDELINGGDGGVQTSGWGDELINGGGGGVQTFGWGDELI
ncbi:hypothetical protein [Ruania albidiflava]|uniref:hypothetical protein n=1 Tax=Ruania albidiflava TaxID=366586 RepID=UPI0023F5558F|nr:hypothetical protein [Ruania albidiflava]